MKRKRSYILSLLALVLILCAFIQPAWAYFTSSKQADGAVPISFIRKTTIEEKVEGLTKSVYIWNDASSTVDVWVRVKAYAGVQFTLAVSGNNWSGPDKDGWWYYSAPVEPGKSTPDPLIVTLSIPGEIKPPDVVNVGVVYESTSVFYNPNGTPKAADWSPEFINYTGSSTP